MSRYFQDRAIGQNKKLRTRGVLFDSALVMFCQEGISNTRLDDITQCAGMANATFYNHFKDKDELVQALAMAMAVELLGPLKGLSVEITDTPTLVAVGNRMVMSAALEQKSWGTFLAQSFYLVPPSYVDVKILMKEIFDMGVEQGFFTVILDEFQMDQVYSVMLSGLRTLDHHDDESLIDRTSENMLRVLGMSPVSASLAVAKGRAFIR